MTISGILYIAWPEDYLAILFGRILGGIAHGILYVTIVSHYGENTAADMRGHSISTIGVIFSSSAVIIALFALNKNEISDDSSYSNRLTGILTLIWSVIGLAVNFFLTIESVPFLLLRDQEQEAIQALMKLRSESTETPSFQNELDDFRQMVDQAKEENQNIFNNGNVRPLLLVAILRLQAFLTNNSIINTYLITVVQFTLGGGTATFVAPVFLTSFRLLGGLIRLLAGDLVTRKWYLTPSGIVSGILLGAFAVVLMNVRLETGFIVMLVWFEFMAGFGIDSMSHVITSEAFAINKKAWSIAFATSIEYVLQLVAIVVMYNRNLTDTTIYGVLLASAILIVLLAMTVYFLLPETLNLTIKQCRDVHRSLKHRSTTNSHIVN